MKALKEKMFDDLVKEVGLIGQKINALSAIETPKELAEMASDGSFGCPSYYGLIHEGCKDYNQAKCRRCWLKALNEAFETPER